MAAYSVLISLRETLKDFIQSDPHQIFECRNGRHLFESLQRNVISMLELFDKFPRKVGKWEKKIHDSCNGAESIIEDHIALTIRRKGEVLRAWLYCICECKKQSSLHSQIYQIGAVIDSIVNEMKSEMELGDNGKEANSEDDSYRRNFSHLNQMPPKQKLFGFEGHLEEIKKRLLYGSSKELQVVPIVGMGGIGKTSLSRALFDDESIVNGFDIRRWAKVSQSCDVKAILLAILGDEDSSCDTNIEIRDIGVLIHQMLYCKRYLLVLDDIWESKAWDEVRMRLPDWKNNSRVLLTTRNEDVARYTKPLESTYALKLLNKETSWSMIKHKVFGEKDCPPELVEIGQKIAEGCHGLPLAIAVIAGILVNVNRTRNSWEKIANDVSKVVETGDEKYSEILALSYYHLPHYLRPYFLFMTTCSKGGNLLNILSSERFLNPKKSSEKYDAEEIVMELVNELIDRNLLIVTKKKYTGKMKSFGTHDLLRDLNIKLSKEEKFLLLNDFAGAAEIISTTRRARFHDRPLLNIVNLPHLRTVICDSKDILATLERCQHLRILTTGVIVPLNMFSERLELCHLRYLHLRISKDERLGVSSAISKLVNLEYLSIDCGCGGCDSGILIDIWKLPKLRFFHASPSGMLPQPMKTSLSFINLRFLMRIRNFRFTKDMVKLIPEVREMDLHYWTCCAGSWSNYYFENVCHLTHLEKLKMRFCGRNYVELMNRVTFPSSLKSLLLSGGEAQVTWEDVTKKIGLLPNLEKLRLRGHAVCGDWEINEGYFPNLRVLEVSDSCIKFWKTDGSGNVFPKLERLILTACPFLTDLPEDIGEIPTLKLIVVDDHQEAIVNWAKEIEQDQPDYVRVIDLRIAAEIKKYEEEVSKDEMLEEKRREDEMFGQLVGEALTDRWVKLEQEIPDNRNKPFQVLLAKIAAELMKYQQFELEKNNKSKMEAFQVIAFKIIAGIDEYTKNVEKHYKSKHQEAIELFRVSVLNMVEVLKKYEEEESKEQKRCYHEEAYKLFQVIVKRIFEEKDKCCKEEIMYVKMHTYLIHDLFQYRDQGLNNHALRSVGYSHPYLASRLHHTKICPLRKVLFVYVSRDRFFKEGWFDQGAT